MSESTPTQMTPGLRLGTQNLDANQAQGQALFQASLTAPIPRLYANAFAIAITPADLIVSVLSNGVPVCLLNLALPTAKGFAEDLAQAVRDYERTSGQTVQALGQINATMEKARQAEVGTSVSKSE